MKFTLLYNALNYVIMHEACGREADPPVGVHQIRLFRSVGTITDMPTLIQRDTRCEWCQFRLSEPADPELMYPDIQKGSLR